MYAIGNWAEGDGKLGRVEILSSSCGRDGYALPGDAEGDITGMRP